MLDDLELNLLRLSGAGYCCSQIMLLLGLEELGRSNPDLVRAASGLCHGMGDCAGPCGVLTGGACLLGLHAGKGHDDEQADERLALLLSELTDWFRETATADFGGISCSQIIGTECGKPDPKRCGGLLSRTYLRIREILVENGLDPSQGRELPDA